MKNIDFVFLMPLLFLFHSSIEGGDHSLGVDRYCVREKVGVGFESFVSLDDVAMRFYLLRRLAKSMTLLHKLDKKNIFLSSCGDIKGDMIYDITDRFAFTQKNVVLCIKEIRRTKNIQPLLKLWNDIKHYRFIKSIGLIKEFSILTFVIYKNLMTHYLPEHMSLREKSVTQSLIQVYEKLDSLPLEEILNAIDLVTEELPFLWEQYQLNSDMTWKEWLKKYWWVPPLVAVTLGIRIFLIFKGRQTHFNIPFGQGSHSNNEPMISIDELESEMLAG